MNKKGYINILFILLIISGAGLFLSFNSVKTSMNNAQKSAFVMDAQTFFNAAETWKTTQIIEGNSDGNCITLESLINLGYIEKEINNYEGYIEFVESDNKIYSYIYITDGEKGFYSKTRDELDESTVTNYNDIIIPSYCE